MIGMTAEHDGGLLPRLGPTKAMMTGPIGVLGMVNGA
jgi:hypothetical protein